MQNNTITQSFNVVGMHCASCAQTIKRKIGKLPGVDSCEVNYGGEKATIAFNPDTVTPKQFNETVQKLGYALEDRTASPHSDDLHAGHDMAALSSDSVQKERKLKELEVLRKQVQLLIPFVIISSIMMGWEVGSMTLQVLPAMPEILSVFLHHLLPLIATYTLFVIGKTYIAAIARFITLRVANMDTLVGIGTLTAFAYSFVLSAFEKVLLPYINTAQSYYDVTIVVIGFITLGKFLEARSKLKTGEAIEKLLNLQPKTALVVRDGREMEVPADQVIVGDIFRVKPGQKIPVDGEITEGSTTIDESMISGESIPVDKRIGDSVIGATINKQGTFLARATKIGSETVLSQIISIVENAQSSKASIERIADTISAIFVPVVLVFAVVMLLLWIVVGSQFMPLSEALTLGIVSFVGILVIACPCAMGLATPMAVIVGVGKAAQYGILVKNAESLEKSDSLNYIVMDKTGTLTKGKPELTDIQPVGELTEMEAARLLASLEKNSEHPLAEAVTVFAAARDLELYAVSNFSAIEGKGVSGVIARKNYSAGNQRLARELSVSIDEKILSSFATQGKTPIILMQENKAVAYFGIADTIKDDAKVVVTQLHSLGLKVAMLTGDTQATAQHIASQVGIDVVFAEVLPADKAQIISNLQSEGNQVAMVGDGINDAPALVTSDVGVAMGSGTDVAIESSDITLLGGQLSKLPKAIKLSRATMRTIKQNLFWAFFYNVIGIPLAAGLLYPFFSIMLNPAIAGAAMAFSSVSVVLNALRLKRLNL